ncbi:protein kinase [Saccharopolyspora sp. NPDC000359]|uniref:serine/threonine-protein kinase n=1 Tax=Saccharopolyspora sp. NPDC000359 TaxID=3154251 RepID=UPI0033229A9C
MKWQFGPYRVEGLIARGGMGEILRAYDTRHDRVVALKLLAANLAADEEFRDRFKREAHAAGRLREPHVIPIHAYGEIDGRLYLDMRLVEGTDVGSLLAARGPMRPADAVVILEQVAQALDAAHAEGLVHRDVKPSNILVGDNGFAYLVDFGIAASLRASGNLTSTGYAVGTLAYMAPERFEDGPVDHRADVYSLACVLYQCLTGAKPFAGETAASLVNAHLNHKPPKPAAIRADLPREFDHIVARGMAKDPADRYGSAGELARAARQALTSVTALPGAFAPVPAQRRVRWPHLAAGAGVLAVIAGSVVFATATRTEPGQAVPVDAPTSLAKPTVPTSDASSLEQPVSEEVEPGGDPETAPAEPAQTKWCQGIRYEGRERGTGCFEAIGDHLFAHDTDKDGMWIKAVAETDYGRVVECADHNSQGDPVDCNFDLREDSRVHFRVELWDAQVKIDDTPWSDFVPIGQ